MSLFSAPFSFCSVQLLCVFKMLLIGDTVIFLLAISFNFKCGDKGDSGKFSRLIKGPINSADAPFNFFF